MLLGRNLEEVGNPRPRPWGQDRRLEFIEFRLLWDGKINRGEVAEYFNVSIQQASLDFAKYMFLAKDNMEYDRREKVYRATKLFTPLFIAPDTQTYLNELSGLTTGTISPSFSLPGRSAAAPAGSLVRIGCGKRAGLNSNLLLIYGSSQTVSPEIQSERRRVHPQCSLSAG